MSSEHREQACAPAIVPTDMAALVDGFVWTRDLVGESGGNVYRLHGKPGMPDLFLKHGHGSVAGDVTDEMTRLLWLSDHVPVPRVMHFVRSADEAWLLMTALPGLTAWQLLAANDDRQGEIVDALADFLRRLHAIPADSCPFNSDHARRLHHARARIDAGQIDTEDFDEERQGWTAEQLWREMTALLPLSPDPVATHGDFSLDNLLITDGKVTGCIDVGRAGIADRYQDLAILWNCLGEFDAALQRRLFERYGLAAPDDAKLRFHLMLDELF